MKNITLSFLFILALTFSLKAQDTRQFTEKGFTRLSLGSAFKVEVEQGSSFNIVAMGSNEDLSDLKATVKGGTLQVKYENNSRNHHRKSVQLRITMPTLQGVDFSGATNVQVARFTGTKNMNIEVSGASKVVMDLSADKLFVALSGASGLVLDGSCAVMNGEISGASSLKAQDLVCEEVNLEASGASRAHVVAQQKLRADASGASSIRYAGTVKNVQSNTSGASSVKRQ